MKKSLFYTILAGFLIITLPCFARDFKFNAYQEYTNPVRILKGYAKDYPASLLIPASVSQVTYNTWHVTFRQESFDIAQFASAFDPEVQSKIFDFILNKIEKKGSSDDLMDHPLIVPVWVSWNSEIKFNQWVQDLQTSGQQGADVSLVVEDDSSSFKTGDMYDFASGFSCPDPLPSVWSKVKQHDEVNLSLQYSSPLSVVKADDDKLPPYPLPYPPLPPRLFVVKADDDKLPPYPLPYPPLPPRLFVVKADDDKLPPYPLPYPPLPPRLFVVKADDDKLPPYPLPYPPLPPRLFVVKAGDDIKVPPYPLPYPPLPPRLATEPGDGNNLPQVSWFFPISSSTWAGADYWNLDDHPYYSNPKLYFVVWPIATPDQRKFSKELLDEFHFEKVEVKAPVGAANGIIDGYGEGDCEFRGVVDIAFTDNFSNNP